jgi:hypothetical protein
MFVTSSRAPRGKVRCTNLVRCDGTASPALTSSLTASLRPDVALGAQSFDPSQRKVVRDAQ